MLDRREKRGRIRRRRSRLCMVYGFALCTFLPLASCRKDLHSGTKYTVAVIPQGLIQEYWKSIHAGAVKATQDLAAQGVNVELIWKGPLREDDREQQARVVEGFISAGISGMVLAP